MRVCLCASVELSKVFALSSTFFFLRWCSCLAVMTTSTRNAAAAIRRLTIEYKQLTTDPNTLFPAVGPISEDNYLEWEALLPGPDDTPFEGGVFSARLSFRMYITITHKSTYIPLRAADHAIRSAYFPPKWCVCVHNPKLFSLSLSLHIHSISRWPCMHQHSSCRW